MLKKLNARVGSRFKKRSYALNGLDKKLLDFLDFKGGIFVEAGANDGIRQSNTLYFEKYKGWTGLLIEAIPALAEKCRNNRPRCIVENCALVATTYLEETIDMQYCNLMSVVKGAMKSEEEEGRHLQEGAKFLSEGEYLYSVSVPALTLSEVLDKHALKRIDLLSLDVEGYEAQALRGLDLDRYSPEYMLIETRYREDVEEVIAAHYASISVLHTNEGPWDILYRRK